MTGSLTIRTARLLLAKLAPMTGERSTGTFRIATRDDVASLEVPANTYLFPVVPSGISGRTQAAPQRLFRTAEACTATPAGVDVAGTSLLGGERHNLAAGTVFRVASRDNRIASVIASTAFAGALPRDDVGGVKLAVMYEQIGQSTAQRDLFLAKVPETPAIVLAWESRGPSTKIGPNLSKRPDSWALHVVVKRQDAGELRTLEGLEILDLMEEILGRATGVDGERITAEGDISLRGATRLAVSDTAYAYTLRIETVGVVRRLDDRELSEFLTLSYSLVSTPEDLTLSPTRLVFVEDAVAQVDEP